ncbi:GLPGLI family protein [Flavobacterium johnsoniae]|uniref:GLPGLI family protein n=1 Tax=Flavobacterium johnsoniae TaxID=986 RepID=UPI0025B0D8F9|nr:GLPGLI family protein [Flavobacterium johnsoniae]WJS95663.1 GLPGLI family protein [Flavobacterium johnsoniae]
MKHFLIFLILFSSTSFAQKTQYKITYDYHIGAKINGLVSMNTYLKTYLTGNGETSIEEQDFVGMQSTATNENSYIIKTKDNPKFYKHNSCILYSDHISLKDFNIKDSIGSFDWQLGSETKTIVGYQCQNATLFFRGRNYTVYFAKDIPFSDGPWKLSGLPGMILEVKTDNDLGQYDWVASKVEIMNAATEITNPFVNKEIIPYDEFVALYVKKYKQIKAQIASYSGSGGMPKGYLELYVTD